MVNAERLAQDCEASREVLKADTKFSIIQAELLEAAEALRAQAERIKELEHFLAQEKKIAEKDHGVWCDNYAALERKYKTARNDALREAAMLGPIPCYDSRHVRLGDQVRAAILALTPTPQRCAECDCENGGDECTWIAPAKPETTPQEAAQIVGRYDEESTCPSCCDVTAINEEITTLIEGDTND